MTDEQARELAEYQYFLSYAHPQTWGTMTMAEWRTAPNNQMVSWDQWCAEHRAPQSAPTLSKDDIDG